MRVLKDLKLGNSKLPGRAKFSNQGLVLGTIVSGVKSEMEGVFNDHSFSIGQDQSYATPQRVGGPINMQSPLRIIGSTSSFIQHYWVDDSALYREVGQDLGF